MMSQVPPRPVLVIGVVGAAAGPHQRIGMIEIVDERLGGEAVGAGSDLARDRAGGGDAGRGQGPGAVAVRARAAAEAGKNCQ